MAIDPALILGYRPAQVVAPSQTDTLQKSLVLSNLLDQGEVNKLGLEEKRRDVSTNERLRALFSDNPNATAEQVMAVDPKRGMEYGAKLTEQTKNKAAAAASEADTRKKTYEANMLQLQHGASLLSTARDPESFANAIQIGVRSGVFTPENADNMLKNGYSPQAVQQYQSLGLKYAEKLKADHDAAVAAETARHNRNTEGNAAANLALARQRESREANAPRGVVQQTAEGTILIDPRTGNAQPVMMNGQPVAGKPAKDIPSNVLSGMMENNRSLNKVNQAIAAIEGRQEALPEGMQADAAATGLKGYLPNFALNRIDQQGTDTRALIADIGSLKIHDRSGAAVSASESPRLMPFIPLATDDAATVSKKLKNFQREYALMQQEMQQYYGPDNGFKEYKPATQEKKPEGPVTFNSMPDPAQYKGRRVKAEDGTIYISDGKSWKRNG